MSPQDDNRGIEPLAALLAAAARDAAPPDREFLKQLGEQSAAVFRATFSPQPLPHPRGRPMILSAFRVAVLATAATILGFFLLPGPDREDKDGLAFGTVLTKVGRSDTLHVKVVRQGQAGEVWARPPQRQLRWDHPDGTYQIARGGKLWQIDEKANRAKSRPSPYYPDAKQPTLDVLTLLDLPAGQREKLAAQRPDGHAEKDGRDLLVYHLNIPSDDGAIALEARVDATTRLLDFVEAKREGKGNAKAIGSLSVVAVNRPIPEDRFVVKDTLTEDGRIGKVGDVQGVVAIKPRMHDRWTPVCEHVLVRQGDWVRTDIRGANAVALRLVKQTGLTLGPGSLAELVKPDQVRLLQGELEVSAVDPIELLGPDQQKIAIKGVQHYRLDGAKLVRVAQEPLWLKGFKGTTANESLGSLIAKVDGRDVPLSVGYHKVTVDIRDQIARTVIEESFVNHTNQLLEGVFYFPLPQDASISGFGMWIGENLIEADVVEKQRAREIYETIKSERRDPGLLEWTGGNIFKASVWPIFASSEKRVRITYTQVLPLEGNRYRYSYGLQSEMLQQHPLRELAIDVKVNSVMPLASVTSPTHSTRSDQTDHSAHLEFSAQEYVPNRDFEAVIELHPPQQEVVVIPHRRGDDGYFLLAITPPASSPKQSADEARALLPNSEPLHLLILADTSASMDPGQRSAQAAFLAALLASLTPRDTINIGACDVNCDWVFEHPLPADLHNVMAARQFLANRVSLGWTNLDKAFASAFKQSGPTTQIIYLGDGIVTAPDSDPAAFAKRLRRLYQGQAGTVHAVAAGNSFEPGTLRAMASLGGGSVRHISSEHGPQSVALALLQEISQPAVRDLKVEFRGLRTARVYPEQLPNIADGTQQILLGRYLPEGRDQVGEVLVTGTRGGQPVKFSTRLTLKDAEQGNSFIPRLWARMHLDHLLEQGNAAAIRDEIIGLSEEYQILTPYTSFLVLETDADRERFKVQRRFRMRDGEKFFAQGRDNANFELAQKQMKQAGTWRLGLHRNVLGRLARLGRDPLRIQPQQYRRSRGLTGYDIYPMSGPVGAMAGCPAPVAVDDMEELGMAGARGFLNGTAVDGALLGDRFDLFKDRLGDLNAGDDGRDLAEKKLPLGAAAPDTMEQLADVDSKSEAEVQDESQLMPGLQNAERAYDEAPDASYANAPLGAKSAELGFRPAGGGPGRFAATYRDIFSRGGSYGFFAKSAIHSPVVWNGFAQWFDGIFPPVPVAAAPSDDATPRWPAPAHALAESLLRTRKLAELAGGLIIDRRTESFDVRWERLTSVSQRHSLYSRTGWLMRSEGDGEQTLIQWCDGRERAIISQPFQLGRVRSSKAEDLRTLPLDLGDYSLASIERAYPGYTTTVEERGKGRAALILRHPSNPLHETHVLVDTDRHVIRAIEQRTHGKVVSAIKFDDFVEAAGCWWARHLEIFDDQGRRVSRTSQTVSAVAADAFEARIKKDLAGRDQVQLLRQPAPSVADAKRDLAAGKATFDDQVALLWHFASSQQWTRVREHLEQAEKLADGKPGLRWLREVVLNASRRHEELKKSTLEEADRLAHAPAAVDGRDHWFLTEYLIGRAAAYFQADEMLSLLDRLQPVYRRQAAYREAMKRWGLQRVNYLYQTGQADAGLRLYEKLAADCPHDYTMQQNYAQALVNAGDHPAALAWLKRVLVPAARWTPSEEEALHNLYAQTLESQGRFPELIEFLADWIKRNPDGAAAYQQYLSALIRTNEIDKANDLMARWLKEARLPGALPTPVAARLQAAVNQALGQGHNLYTNHIEERWLTPLAEAALFFGRHESQFSIADSIMSHWQFQQSDECRRVRKTVADVLVADVAKLPVGQIQRYVQWIWPNNPVVEMETWKRIADGLRDRWEKETRPDIKNPLADQLVQILRDRIGAPALIAFLHRQWREGPATHRVGYARQLFDTLIGQPWSAEYEDEAFTLLEKLADSHDEDARLFVQVEALYRLTDTMLAARYTALMKAVEHQEKLTRTELKKKQDDNRRRARTEYADRLRKEAAKHGKELTPWLVVERLYVDTLLGRDLAQVAAECWEFLGAAPPPPRDPKAIGERAEQLQEILQHRYLFTLANLATRPGVAPDLAKRLVQYLDKRSAATGDNSRWKLIKVMMLIALDRPRELERVLQTWVAAGDADSRWHVALGYLLAEQGRLPLAIGLFEQIEKSDELGPTEYRTLADWYLVLNQRERHDRALIAAFKTLPEHYLSQWINRDLNPWQRGDGNLPTEVDPEVLLLFTALFEKSTYPQNYVWQLQQFYQASRDFRLLTGLADAVVGHTAGQVYPFLQNMQGVLNEVRDEATADAIVEQIARVRARAKTAVDHRALDLLAAQVERRAAELKNQPGPHGAKALAALQRAFRREWSSGEQRLMADFLAGLGSIAQQPLAKEQVRQLEELHRGQAKGTFDRLHLAHRLASTLGAYSRTLEAADLLQAGLQEFQDAQDGVLPATANDALNTLITLLETARHFDRGEKVLLDQLRHPVHHQQTLWLTQRLDRLYLSALQNGGDVALGSGQTLYEAVERKLRADLATPDPNHRYNLVEILCSVYRAAHDKKLTGVLDDLQAFAFKQLPHFLREQVANYEAVVNNTLAQTVHDLRGPRDGAAFLLERIETEPEWLRFNNQDGWSRFGWTIATWRTEAKGLGELDDRLLKVVVFELRRDLETRQRRNQALYYKGNVHYWQEKEEVFAKAAEQVLAQRSQSAAAVAYIADYFYWGVGQSARAIEIMFDAYRRNILDDGQQFQLTEYLHQQNRHAEAVPLLQALVKRRTDSLSYRVSLLRAYFRTGRQADLLALLQDTDAFFHKDDRWTEGTIAGLAWSCVENHLFTQAVAYYNEVIPLHQRTQPRRGVGNGTLSSYYANLSQAYAGLNKTAEAVDAAAGAIVSWGPRQHQRTAAVATLKQVLYQAPDLDGYVAQLDKQEAASGLHSAVIRKALGLVYFEKAQYPKAIIQLQQAASVQPFDAETQQTLINCFDKQGDNEGVIRQLLQAVQTARRDLKKYQALGQRLETVGRPAEAERAFTSIMDVMPNEVESHALLAEVREQQNRWSEAMALWQRVAELRSAEPTGLLKLAAAQVHEHLWEQAAQTLRQLNGKSWPVRFGDVAVQIRVLEQQVEKGRQM
jgi:Tfp pilus assembly protein PilF